MSENSIKNTPLLVHQTIRPNAGPSSAPAPRLPAELLENVIDCLGSEDLLDNLRVSKQWQALSMRTSRLQRHVADHGSFGTASSHPQILLPQLASIVRAKANLEGGRVTQRIERPMQPENLGFVEVAGEMYRVINARDERERQRWSYVGGESLNGQAHLRATQENAAPGEMALAQVTSDYVLKRCGFKGRYLSAPSFLKPTHYHYRFARDLRYFAAFDGATVMTQQGDDVATRTTLHVPGKLISMTYADAHLLVVSESDVRVLDAEDRHRVIFSVAPRGISAAWLSQNGKILAVSCLANGNERAFQFFDTSDGRLLHEWAVGTLNIAHRRPDGFALDPAGRFFAVSPLPNKVTLCDIDAGQAVDFDVEIGPRDGVQSVCFSPMKKYIGCEHRSGRCYDLQENRGPARTPHPHSA